MTVTTNPADALDPDHMADLRQSGLSDDTIARCGFRTVTDPAEAAGILKWKSPAYAAAVTPALVIPYFARDGSALPDYTRLRPTTPRPDAKDSTKRIKYESPKGVANRIYFPPGAGAWDDPAAPLVITEGEKKAAKATQDGFPCVGLVGVYGWQVKGDKGPVRGLAPDLADLPWQGRRVAVVFDSDAARNDKVRAAERHLARALAAAGAKVRVVRLPAAADGSKQGVDDFLVSAGPDALRLLTDLPDPPPGGGPPAGGPKADAKDAREKPPAAADILAGIATAGGATLFHDDAGTAYAAVGPRTYRVRATTYRQHLIGQYRRLCAGRVPNAEAVAAALSAIEADAVHDGPERPVFVRVAGHAGKVYYHLADEAGTVIEIDAAGWRVCPDPPVRFWKSPGLLAVPMPEPGGAVAELKHFVNCPDADAFALLLGFVAACLLPDGPFPLLVLTGEQGSAKSFTAKVLKTIIDPTVAPIRTGPKEARDLMIAASRSRLLAFDNISTLPEWLSDALCRLATGGGFSTRTLYEDNEETVFDAKRPVVLNGIEDFVTRADLLERSVVLHHRHIPDGERRQETELWPAFEAARPKLLGALLGRVSAGLRALPGVDKTNLPRMADAAAFAVACEAGAGEPPRFLAAYRANQRDAYDLALADSPVVGPLLAVMADRNEWQGTPTELFHAAAAHVPEPRPKDWPKRPNGFTGHVRRAAPSLRRVHGLDVDTDGKGADRNRTRAVRITRLPAKGRETPSAPSAPSERPGFVGETADDPRAGDRPDHRPHRPGADGPGPVTAGSADDADDPADDPGGFPPSARNATKTSVPDGTDDADDGFPPSTAGTPKARVRRRPADPAARLGRGAA